MLRQAALSADGLHRHWLRRAWDIEGGVAVFVMLNPSHATASRDDPTLKRCIGFAEGFGFSEIILVNLTTYRSPHPQTMKTWLRENDSDTLKFNDFLHVERELLPGRTIIAAWGSLVNQQEPIRERAEKIRAHCHAYRIPLHALKLNDDGSPAHPLYLKGDSKLRPYTYDL